MRKLILAVTLALGAALAAPAAVMAAPAFGPMVAGPASDIHTVQGYLEGARPMGRDAVGVGVGRGGGYYRAPGRGYGRGYGRQPRYGYGRHYGRRGYYDRRHRW